MLEIHLAEKPPRRGKTLNLHTTILCIASPLHIKWRNQEGSCAARHQLLTYYGDTDQKVSK
jgi:hypothetical protein